MRNKSRETILKIAVGAVVGFFLLDRVVLTPALAGWKSQGEQLTALRQQVQRGRQLIEREPSIRARWEDMQRADMPDDSSAAEDEVFKAVQRWAIESGGTFTSITNQWRGNVEGSDAFEIRATVTGDQSALGRLLYQIETDVLPARIEECEWTARDAKGQQLGLALRVSFLRIAEAGRSTR